MTLGAGPAAAAGSAVPPSVRLLLSGRPGVLGGKPDNPPAAPVLLPARECAGRQEETVTSQPASSRDQRW